MTKERLPMVKHIGGSGQLNYIRSLHFLQATGHSNAYAFTKRSVNLSADILNSEEESFTASRILTRGELRQ